MSELDRDSFLPLYVQIQNELLSLIEQYKQDHTIKRPIKFTEVDLVKRFGVSRLTVRQAVDNLVRSGVLYRVKGVGTFVNETKIEQPLSKIERFLNEDSGFTTDIRILSFRYIKAPYDIALSLNIPAETEVLSFERLRINNNQPFAVDRRYLLDKYGELVTRGDVEREPAVDTICKVAKASIHKVTIDLEAIPCPIDIAKVLEISVKTPVLKRTVTVFIPSNFAISTGSTYYRWDRFKYHTEIIEDN